MCLGALLLVLFILHRQAHFRPDAPAARGAASVAAAAAPPASRRSSRVPAPRKQLGSQRLRLDHALPHRPQRPRTPAATRARARARAPSARLERPRGSAVAPFTATAAPPQRASSRGCGGGEGCHVAAVSVSLRVGARVRPRTAQTGVGRRLRCTRGVALREGRLQLLAMCLFHGGNGSRSRLTGVGHAHTRVCTLATIFHICWLD
mmetsp:Transcript_12094/g.38829  ORF Transcript_12094/g.38829 Transcript_12094/m.38829 type:complete len:206 (+) Transcript_12094:640-1257(+)